MPRVRVLYFAHARDAARTAAEDLEVPAQVDPPLLRTLLAQAHPGLATLLPVCRFALAQAFIDGPVAPTPGEELAVIPPVSGG